MQPTPTRISLCEARELVARPLSSALAERLLVERLDAKRIEWRHGHIENSSGVSIETALDGFWRSASINWDESWAARKVEAPPVAARGGVAPGGIVWASPPTRPTQPSSQLGNNLAVYDIRLAREDVELLLREYGEPASEPASEAEPAPSSASTTERHADPQGDQKRAHPQGDRVRIVLRKEFPPDGTVPPPSELSDSDLVARVSQHFPAHKKPDDPLIPGRKSILRAAGRLPRK